MITWLKKQINTQEVNVWDTNKLLDYSSLIFVYYWTIWAWRFLLGTIHKILTQDHKMSFLSTIEKYCCKVLQNKALKVIERLAALKSHWKSCIIKCIFSIGAICTPRTNYFNVKQMFSIQALSLLNTNGH